MRTFQQLYCAKHRCTVQQFQRRLFWQGLYPHARLLAGPIRLLHRRFFTADEALVRLVAEATTMRSVREEVRDYFWDSNNRGWLRRVANIRVSGQRVKNLARRYLPESDAAPRGSAQPVEPAGAELGVGETIGGSG